MWKMTFLPGASDREDPGLLRRLLSFWLGRIRKRVRTGGGAPGGKSAGLPWIRSGLQRRWAAGGSCFPAPRRSRRNASDQDDGGNGMRAQIGLSEKPSSGCGDRGEALCKELGMRYIHLRDLQCYGPGATIRGRWWNPAWTPLLEMRPFLWGPAPRNGILFTLPIWQRRCGRFWRC